MHRGRQFLWNALKTECVIHDQSFMVPIVLTGPLESGLKSMLSRLLVSECTVGLSDIFYHCCSPCNC